MLVMSKLKRSYLGWLQNRAKQSVLKNADPNDQKVLFGDWKESLTHPTEFYLRCFRFFHQELPEDLQLHRSYFSKNGRGFGEDAFHTMWFLLVQKFRPDNFLEIGVYRGQSLSLVMLLQIKNGLKPNVVGISPFESAGDSVTRYRSDVDYFEDTLANFKYFALPEPTLFKAYSTEERAVQLISSQRWDCIYIDGNHDYEVVQADWKTCSEFIKPGGIIVLDDSSLKTTFQAPVFASQGHPGPSRIAEEIDSSMFTEILRVGHNRVFRRNP